mmetsp:Transcript_108396/g.171016  ORF Transcript_108396/g.171016 Transcript_108396/m.171016 type:complete len:566 (+) Transcript_108396:73-1770(+)|eukprot:CAMPEP_0169079492 /NCGR_PEP_ID=MMETSP1015-20121227/9975_1 /TAXON_ID=342587 /ORGANISM="Karlodinium micrum, Strain CCMP2283" /LENGTH=565 /DNA_ID=CAMNT_0009139155 /DNA_START=63 /DNA_END=1760 /DNA_ORIENTATION=-
MLLGRGVLGAGKFWPSEETLPHPAAGSDGLSARQRKQVYETHVSHFSDGHSLGAPTGKAVPCVYDHSHQQRLLEVAQANASITWSARSLPSRALLPNPKDMRLTMNAGHGFVLPSSQSPQSALSDCRIRGSDTTDQLMKPSGDAASNSSSKENRNCASANANDAQMQARGVDPRCTLQRSTTDALQVIQAQPSDGAIPSEFKNLSSNLQVLDNRAEIITSPRKDLRSPRSASDRKKLNLSLSEGFGGLFSKADRSSPSSLPKVCRSPRDRDIWQDAITAQWYKPPECFSRPTGYAPIASYAELIDACRKGDKTEVAEVNSPIASQRKSAGLELSPSSPFLMERRVSRSPSSSVRRSQSLCESPRRRKERNFSDLFGQESLPRPSSRCSRSQIADSAVISSLDTRVELSNLRSPRVAESPRRRTEKNYSDLFDTSMPDRQRQRSHSPEQLVREEERCCWDSRMRLEMNAEIERRIKENILIRSGALPPPKETSASEKKRLELTSGNMRLCCGDSPREWDDGRRGPGPAPKGLTMRMRSGPDISRFRQHNSPARERYVRSVLTSDNF